MKVGDKLYCKNTSIIIDVVKDRIYEITHIRGDHIRLIHINKCQELFIWITKEQLYLFYTQEELRLKKLESL